MTCGDSVVLQRGLRGDERAKSIRLAQGKFGRLGVDVAVTFTNLRKVARIHTTTVTSFTKNLSQPRLAERRKGW